MHIITLWKIRCHQETHFPLFSSILSSVSVPVAGMWAKPHLIYYKNILEILTVLPLSPLYRDHKEFGKNANSFIHTFLKYIKTCVENVNNCFSFSIPIPAEYFTVLVINYAPNFFHLASKATSRFFFQSQHW